MILPGLPFGLSGGRLPLIFVGAAVSSGFNVSSGSVSLTSLTGGFRSAAQSGDIVLAAIGSNVNGSGALSSAVTTVGYSELFDFSRLAGDNSFRISLACSRKILSASDASVAFNLSTTASFQAIAYVFSRGDQANPIDVTSTIANGVGASGGVDPPSITTATSNSEVVALAFGAYTITGAPSGMGNYILSGELAAASVARPSVGAYNPPAFANTGASLGSISPWLAATIALRPK